MSFFETNFVTNDFKNHLVQLPDKSKQVKKSERKHLISFIELQTTQMITVLPFIMVMVSVQSEATDSPTIGAVEAIARFESKSHSSYRQH